jgi:hypothetical protein
MENKKPEQNKQVKATPKVNNDQLGENASEMNSKNYANKGSQATEKRR